MKKILSVILSILFGILLFITLMLGLLRVNFNQNKVKKITTELLKPVAYVNKTHYLADFSENEYSIGDIKNINEIVQFYCKQYGYDVSEEFVQEILDDKVTTDFVEKYSSQIIDYFTDNTLEINIDENDILNVLNNAVEKYEIETGKKIDKKDFQENILNDVHESTENINKNLQNFKETNKSKINKIQVFFNIISLRNLMILIIILLIIICAIFILNKNIVKFIKYIAIPVLVNGLIIFIASVIFNTVYINYFSSESLKILLNAENIKYYSVIKLIQNSLEKIFLQMKITGIICSLFGTIFLSLSLKLDK